MSDPASRIGRFVSNHAYLACGCLVSLALAYPARAKTLEAVQKELVQNQAKYKAYSAKTTMKMVSDMGQGNKMQVESTGTMEWAQRGSKVLYRIDSKTATVMTMQGKETKTKSETLVVCDGDFIYTLNSEGQQKTAIKMKVQQQASYDTKAMFEAWRKDYTLKLLADEKIEGKDCYVIEATPKKPQPHNPVVKQKCWFRKDLGITVKVVTLDKNNKPTSTMTTTDVKINVEIKPDRFKFKLPPGVKLMDMTKQQYQPPAESQPAKDQDATESKADKDEEPEPEKKPEKEKKDKGLKGLLDKLR